jgi:predicted Zn-ribbon and HTH transcriptional regulator
MDENIVFGAKEAHSKAEWGTDEYFATEKAYIQALVNDGKTELEAAQILLSDTYFETGCCDTKEQADRLAGIVPKRQPDLNEKSNTEPVVIGDYWCTPEGEKESLDHSNEDLVRAIAESGHLTNYSDDLIIYEYPYNPRKKKADPPPSIRVVTRAGKYMLLRRVDLKPRKDSKKPRETTIWLPFYNPSIQNGADINEIMDYLNTNPKIRYKKRIDIIKSAKKVGMAVFKRCKCCGYLFSVNGMREQFCNDCKNKSHRKAVRVYRDKKRPCRKTFPQDDDRHLLSPEKGLIPCMRCGRLFPGIRAKYCPACKVAEWRKRRSIGPGTIG